MHRFTLYLFLLTTSFAFSQKYIDMTEELSNIKGHLAVDGNTLQYKNNTKDQIIITGKDLVLNDRSSFMFNNVILQLSGKIIVKGAAKPSLINSYIFCKNSGALKSPNIIEKDDLKSINIGDVAYIKSLKGNPELWVYDISGQRVFKGTKKDAENFTVPISKYDVKVVGVEFKDSVLFVN